MNSEQYSAVTNTITTAKILTRDVLPKLTGYLDASDVVEFYAVTRMAKLKTPPVPQPRLTDAPSTAPTSYPTMQPTEPLEHAFSGTTFNSSDIGSNSTDESNYYTEYENESNDDGNRTLMRWPKNAWGRGNGEEGISEYLPVSFQILRNLTTMNSVFLKKIENETCSFLKTDIESRNKSLLSSLIYGIATAG
jgi:hypothetical protein